DGDGSIFNRHAVDFAVEGDTVEGGRGKAVLVIVFRHERRQVRNLGGSHIFVKRAAAPRRKDTRCIAGADGDFDFGFVSVVVDRYNFALNSGCVLLEPIDGLLYQRGSFTYSLMMPHRDRLSGRSISRRGRSTTVQQKDQQRGGREPATSTRENSHHSPL